MNRRDFLAASAVAGTAALAGHPADAQQAGPRDYYELRRYQTVNSTKTGALNNFLRDVAIPAYGRAGLGPTGVFSVLYGENAPSVYVLMTHRSLASVETLRDRLAQDAEYNRAGASFLEAAIADPGYVRYESTIFRAFQGMPQLAVPATATGNQARIFELRRYEGHTEAANRRKVEMFDKGEIAIFRKTGLTPVFFGEALAGANLPHLTYMLTFENMAARDAAWAVFTADPEWRQMSGDPYYANTVSAITDTILRPTNFSQI